MKKALGIFLTLPIWIALVLFIPIMLPIYLLWVGIEILDNPNQTVKESFQAAYECLKEF